MTQRGLLLVLSSWIASSHGAVREATPTQAGLDLIQDTSSLPAYERSTHI